jgi:hypothetical protein
MTARYSHLSDEHLDHAARRLDGVLEPPGAYAAETLPKIDDAEERLLN